MLRNLLLVFCVVCIATNVVSAQIDIALYNESTFHNFPQQIEFAKTADGTIWLLQNVGFAGDVIHTYKDGTWQEITFEECGNCSYRIATDNNGGLFMSTSQAFFDLQSNALEATNLYFESSGKIATIETIGLELDFKQFFEYYQIINSKHLAKRIDMNETLLSQYVNGKKKPSKKQVNRIVEGLHEIGRELVELTLV